MDDRGQTIRRGLMLAILFVASFVLVFVAAFVAFRFLMMVMGIADHPANWLSEIGGFFHDFFHVFQEPERLAVGLLVYSPLIGAYAFALVALIAPLVGPLRLTATGRSLRTSMIGAGIIAGVLTACAIATLIEFFAVMNDSLSTLRHLFFPDGGATYFTIFTTWILFGALWVVILRRVGRSRDPNKLDRMVRLLFAGSAAEVTLGIPLYILARRKESCYCSLASFWTLVLGLSSLMLLCGPAVVLLLTRESRRMWLRESCDNCGYPRRTGASKCSECGFEFNRVSA